MLIPNKKLFSFIHEIFSIVRKAVLKVRIRKLKRDEDFKRYKTSQQLC